MAIIALVAAMPEETRPVLRCVSVERESLAGFPLYKFTMGEDTCWLIETGMGACRAAAAATALIKTIRPGAIISYGFCGAASPGPTTGDLIVAEHLFSCRHNLTAETGLHRELTDSLATALESKASCLGGSVFRGTFITTMEVIRKETAVSLLPEHALFPALEMETSAVTRVAAMEGIPMAAVRAVSDDFSEELGFSVSEFVDQEMMIRPGRVLLTVAKRPWIIPQLFRLARNSKLAGERLAAAVQIAAEIGGKFAQRR